RLTTCVRRPSAMPAWVPRGCAPVDDAAGWRAPPCTADGLSFAATCCAAASSTAVPASRLPGSMRAGPGSSIARRKAAPPGDERGGCRTRSLRPPVGHARGVCLHRRAAENQCKRRLCLARGAVLPRARLLRQARGRCFGFAAPAVAGRPVADRCESRLGVHLRPAGAGGILVAAADPAAGGHAAGGT